MTDLDEDIKGFQAIPIEAVIEPVRKADEVVVKAQKQLAKKVEEAFPLETVIRKGNQVYKVVGHGMYWSDPGKVKLKNVSNYANININVTLKSDLKDVTIIKHPDYE